MYAICRLHVLRANEKTGTSRQGFRFFLLRLERGNFKTFLIHIFRLYLFYFSKIFYVNICLGFIQCNQKLTIIIKTKIRKTINQSKKNNIYI